LEYCEQDLFTFLEKRKFVISEPLASKIIYKILTAIYYIHHFGIAHRDLKPENILVTGVENNPDIRITDFGLSKIIGPSEKCVEPFGTLGYAAPEVLLHNPYNKAVDYWSIGVITYLMLMGKLPFDGKSDIEIYTKTIEDKIPFNTRANKSISQDAVIFIASKTKILIQ